MEKEQTWRVTVDGVDHTVTYVQPGLRSGAATLRVDDVGRTIILHSGYLDEPIDVGGKECRFVLREYLPDLAVDGVFLDSGKLYAPISPIPTWCRVLTAVTILACFALVRRLLPAMLLSFAAWRGSEYIAWRSGVPAEKKLTLYLGLLAAIWLLTAAIRLTGLSGW